MKVYSGISMKAIFTTRCFTMLFLKKCCCIFIVIVSDDIYLSKIADMTGAMWNLQYIYGCSLPYGCTIYYLGAMFGRCCHNSESEDVRTCCHLEMTSIMTAWTRHDTAVQAGLFVECGFRGFLNCSRLYYKKNVLYKLIYRHLIVH